MDERLNLGSENDFITLLKAYLGQKKTILLVGRCEVNYVGRARSTLECGDRVILVKEDGSIIVHRPYGYQPVNWQPPGCVFHVKKLGERCLLKAVRRRPRESLEVTFTHIYMIQGFSLKDEGKFSLHVSEVEMKRALTLKPELLEPGFRVLRPEKPVRPGFVDLYGVDREGRSVVVELKRTAADRPAILQLFKYIESLGGRGAVRGVIAAPCLAKGAQRLIEQMGLEFKRVDPKECAEVLSSTAWRTRSLSDYIDEQTV
ncbi:MAG: endonuclease NucS [Candidatus Bathyarchaeia archaeon]